MDSEFSESVTSVRERARQRDKEFRITRRSVLRNSHRVKLNDIEKDLQIISTVEIPFICSQLKKKKDKKTLQKIRQGVCVGGESITAFMNVDGALYNIVGCLS
ncbi:hypothetical protein SK128_023593, partial [Halocaridina rubra]